MFGAQFAMSNDGGVTSLDPEEPIVGFADVDNTTLVPDDAVAMTRRSLVMGISGIATSVLIAVLAIVPSPYAIGAPGPTFDTLGEVGEVSLVSIGGAPTYQTSGELRLTTVSVSRASTQPFTMGRVIYGFFAPSQYVRPEEDVFGSPDEEQTFSERSAQMWITSQERATVSALEALDIDVPAQLRVAGLDEFSQAQGLLEENDTLLAIDGLSLASFSELSQYMSSVKPGDSVTLTIARDGDQQEVSFATIEGDAGQALMGIWIDPLFDIPLDVTVQIDSVGGSSAGLMFSLAIMSLLTEADELNGARVAGTGAMTADGEVQPIGGIRLKLHGARAAGSTHFLAPQGNCEEVVGHIPHGLRVVAVETLEDAYAAIVSIGQGNEAALPSC